jgi:hypothetical protein
VGLEHPEGPEPQQHLEHLIRLEHPEFLVILGFQKRPERLLYLVNPEHLDHLEHLGYLENLKILEHL